MIKACMPYYQVLHKKTFDACKKSKLLYWNEDECMCYGTLIHFARNMLIAQNTIVRPEIDKRFTHFLALDSDISFNDAHVQMLIDADKDIISGVYRKPEFDGRVVAGRMTPKGPVFVREINGIEEMDWCGMGFCLINRRVFETIPAPWYELPIEQEGKHYRAYGEDVAFCRKAKEHGFKTYVHGGCEVEHLPKKIILQ